jgi:hypothetical protein
MRRSISVVAVLGLLSSAAIMVAVPIAQAHIVIGQSIAGVKLGDSETQVTALLGAPTSNANGSLFYTSSVGLRIGVEAGKVKDVLSFSKKQKTSKGITIGSSRAQLKRAYPRDCSGGAGGGGLGANVVMCRGIGLRMSSSRLWWSSRRG